MAGRRSRESDDPGAEPLADVVVRLRGRKPGPAIGDNDYAETGAENVRYVLTADERRARDAYDPDRAAAIAEEYSEGSDSLRALHDSNPREIPPPLVIRRWRRQNPEFDAIFRDAQRVKAESMMEETLSIANGVDYNVAKNQIAVRQKLAAAYDRDVFGETQTLLGDRSRPLTIGAASVTAGVSEDDLMAIAARGRPVGRVIDGRGAAETKALPLPADP